MKLKSRNKVVFDISTLSELELYMKDYMYSNLKSIPNKFKSVLLDIINIEYMYKTDFHKQIRKVFSENGKVISAYQPAFWINRGYGKDTVDSIISSIQKRNSPRCIEYWKYNGFNENEALEEISKLQKKYGDVNKHTSIDILQERSCFSTKYWVSRHGYTEADAVTKVSNIQSDICNNYWKSATKSQRQRHRHFGENNGMFGKPPPTNSGNGYSGWYKDKFFRSLHELNYMVNVLEYRDIKYKTAETSEYRIKYVNYTGNTKTYCGDFIVADKYYVEIKPKALFNTIENQLKKAAAIKFCENNGLIYKMTDCGIISTEQLMNLIDNGVVILTKNSENKLNEYLLKINH